MQTELVEADHAQKTEIVLLPPPERAAIALNTEKTEAALREAVAKHKPLTEIKNKAGRDQVHGAAMELMRLRTGLVATSKQVREDAVAFTKAVSSEEARLVAIVEPEEKRLKALRDKWDEEEKARKAEAERVERLRKEAIAERINDIKAHRALAKDCRTAAMVKNLIDSLTARWEGYDVKALFEEFAQEATIAYRITVDAMQATMGEKQAAEEEAERVRQAQREAEERIAAERARAEAAEAEVAALRAQLAAANAPAPAPELVVIGADLASGLDMHVEVEMRVPAEVAQAVQADPQGAATFLATEAAETAQEQAEIAAGFQAAATAPLPTKQQEPETPDAPTALAMAEAIAKAFNVSLTTATDWLCMRADEFFNLPE
jgi:hypothetical protein